MCHRAIRRPARGLSEAQAGSGRPAESSLPLLTNARPRAGGESRPDRRPETLHAGTGILHCPVFPPRGAIRPNSRGGVRGSSGIFAAAIRYADWGLVVSPCVSKRAVRIPSIHRDAAGRVIPPSGVFRCFGKFFAVRSEGLQGPIVHIRIQNEMPTAFPVDRHRRFVVPVVFAPVSAPAHRSVACCSGVPRYRKRKRTTASPRRDEYGQQPIVFCAASRTIISHGSHRFRRCIPGRTVRRTDLSQPA